MSKLISDNAAAEQVAEPDFLIASLLKSRLAPALGPASMSDLFEFVDGQIRVLAERLRRYLGHQLTDPEMVKAAESVLVAWDALPDEAHGADAVAYEGVLWHAVWTIYHLADEEHRKDGVTNPALHECLHLLESRAPLPQHYVARRPEAQA